MTETEFQNRLVQQHFRCAMCGEPFTDEREPVVDHDHVTDEVRALLHQICNRWLGVFEKCHEQASSYLRRVRNGDYNQQDVADGTSRLSDGTICTEAGEGSTSEAVDGGREVETGQVGDAQPQQ
jgi:hypothetical protein